MSKKLDLKKEVTNQMNKFKEQGLEALNEMEQKINAENLIKSNKFEFEVDDKEFMIREPNKKELKEISRQVRKKYQELLNDDSYLFQEQIVEALKKKGINLEEKEKKMSELTNEVRNLFIKLATTENKQAIDKLKKKINSKRQEQMELNSYIINKLEFSIEQQLQITELAYTAYLVLESKNEDGEYKKHFDTFEESEDCDNYELINKTHYYLNCMLHRLTDKER